MDEGNPTRKDNGGVSSAAGKIELTFTASPWNLNITATVENFDQALAMLEQAKRYFEGLLRVQAMAQMQKQIEEQRTAAAIAESVRGNLRGH